MLRTTDSLSLQVLALGDTARFEQLFTLYRGALPEHEQKSRAALHTMLATPGYVFSYAEQHGEVIGFAIHYTCRGAAIALLEYLAVAKAVRSSGLGARLFAHAAEASAPAPLLVEMDAPDAADVQTLRRQRFYERQGCRRIDGLMYLLPLPDRVAPPMWLLVCTERAELSRAELSLWLRTLYTEVYGRPADDPRLRSMLNDLSFPVRLQKKEPLT